MPPHVDPQVGTILHHQIYKLWSTKLHMEYFEGLEKLSSLKNVAFKYIKQHYKISFSLQNNSP